MHHEEVLLLPHEDGLHVVWNPGRLIQASVDVDNAIHIITLHKGSIISLTFHSLQYWWNIIWTVELLLELGFERSD